MDTKNALNSLAQELENGQISRREFIKLALGLGITMPSILASISACVPAPTPEKPSASTVAPAATATTPATAEAVKKTKVVYGSGADFVTFDPHTQLTGIEDSFLKNIYDGLIDWTGKPGEYTPSLATEWSLAEDNVTWTFKLREGVKFHDGSEFDADAVKFNIDRALRSEGAAWRWEPYVKSSEVIDKYTIKIVSPKPHSGFLDNASWGSVVFHSVKAHEEYGEEGLRQHPVGTGPFIFQEWKPGEYVRVKRNPNYWREGPQIEELEFRVIPDYSTRALALESGDLDMISNVNMADVERLRQVSGLKIETYLSVRNMFCAPNLTKPLIGKIEVRQALNYAVDRDAICKSVMLDLTRPSYGPFSSSAFGFKIPETKYTYDPEKAKALLKQAGVAPGTKLVMMTTEGRYYGDRQVAEALQGMFNAVGFDTEIWQLDWPTYSDYMNNKGPGEPMVDKRDLILTDFGSQDPIFNLYVDLYSGNQKNWSGREGANAYFTDDPKLDQLLLDGWAEMDVEKRKVIFEEIQDYIAEQAYKVFIMEQSQVYGLKSDLMGFEALPNQQWSWRKCYWA